VIGVALGVAGMALALLAFLKGALAPALFIAVETGIVVGGVLFERTLYKPLEAGVPSGDWTPTPERFVDDATGELVTVYVKTATGERKYVTAGEAQAASPAATGRGS
jgi:hypothetical protein